MRILLLTDSLGCPREETHVSETWTDRILKKWSGNGIVFYTYCVHGLSVERIHLNYLREISPDMVIMQIGIVDACRRALGMYEYEVVSRIPVINVIARKICRKFHYFLTLIRNVHYCSEKKFNKKLQQIFNDLEGKAFFIKIAPPGRKLIKKCYHIKQDIGVYNSIASKIFKVNFFDPYGERVSDTYLLSDGHHLNSLGNDLLYNAVNQIICENVSFEKK